MVSVGTTILNTVSTDDPMGVDFFVSEKQLSFFEAIKANKQALIDSLFTIILPNDSIYPYLGKISIIDRAVDPQAGTIHIRVVFPNPHYALKPGISCVLRVHNQDKGPKIVIPGKAILELMGEYFVYIAKDTMAFNAGDSTKTHPALIAIQKKVLLGQTIPPNVIVKSGLKVGDNIVVDGVQSLHTGTIINIAGKPKPGKKKLSN
jgi:membrane fusion protein (multidrug efflux system)